MRALPVLKDTIDLIVTAAHVTGSIGCECARSAGRSAAELDALGQLLWDENYSSVSYVEGIHLRAPRYEWRPVAELMRPRWSDEQVLQVARTRLYLEEVSCHLDSWDYSAGSRVLEALARWIAQRMTGFPVAESPTDAGVIEYVGLHRFPEEWFRSIGWRSPLSTADATRLAHHGGRS